MSEYKIVYEDFGGSNSDSPIIGKIEKISDEPAPSDFGYYTCGACGEYHHKDSVCPIFSPPHIQSKKWVEFKDGTILHLTRGDRIDPVFNSGGNDYFYVHINGTFSTIYTKNITRDEFVRLWKAAL